MCIYIYIWRVCQTRVHKSLIGHSGRFPFNPKFRKFLFAQGLVRPEYSGSAQKVVHFDRSGHFDLSDRNVSFHLAKLLFSIPLSCILLTRTITKRAVAVAWVGSEQPECTVPLGAWNFRNFKTEFLLNGKRPLSLSSGQARRVNQRLDYH